MSIRRFLIDLTDRLGPDLALACRTRPASDLKRDVHDIVTVHDRATEAQIREAIFAAYPDSVFLGEEGGWHGPDGPTEEPSGGWVWIVDPIDGTSNFAAGWDRWCISIGLVIDNTLAVGVISQPTTGTVWSSDETGAYVRRDGLETPLRVDPEAQPKDYLCVTEYPHVYSPQGWEQWSGPAEAFRSMRRTGSTALDLAYVAEGLAGGSFSGAVNPWDVAGGIAIITAAGGIYESYNGTEPTAYPWQGSHYIAAISAPCAEAIRRTFP